MAGGVQYGKQMKYPYSVLGKLMQFPWKWHWKHGRAIRYLAYTSILIFPVFWKLDQLVNSPDNVKVWKEIRENRYHDHFTVRDDH